MEETEHTGLYFENTVKWEKGYRENTVKPFREVPEHKGLYFKNTVKRHKGYCSSTREIPNGN